MKDMKRLALSFVLVLVVSAVVQASCVEHAVLRDTDFFSSRYRWSNGRVDIKMWDSPSMVRISGGLVPGAHVTVLERRGNFLKVRAREEHGGQVGWISMALVDITFQQPVEGSGADCGVAVAIEPEPERAVRSARERKAGGTRLQAQSFDKDEDSTLD